MADIIPYFRPHWLRHRSHDERRFNHRASDRAYDSTRRDPAAKKFYNSDNWKRLRVLKLVETPYCEDCMIKGDLTPATTVHHVAELRQSADTARDLDNLRSLCHSCHSRHHARNRRP